MSQRAKAENPNCLETYATFRLVGDPLDPLTVSKMLQIEPNVSMVKGTRLLGRTANGSAQKGVWGITSEKQVHSTSLERHLVYLIDILEKKHEELKELIKENNFICEFLCYWMSDTGYGGPIISPETLCRIANLYAELDFDFYCSE